MQIHRKYDHLFFDLDNTLWDFDANAKSALRQTVKEMGLDENIPDFDSFFAYYEQVNSRLWDAYRKQEISKTELTGKRFEITLEHYGINNINPLVMNNLYLEVMPTYTQLVDGALETLGYLKSKGYHLHIITNGFKEVQLKKMKNSGLAPYFEKIFVSEEISAPKPDKRIFRHALVNCNAKKEKSLMIGDSWDTDILGAKNVGLAQVFFQRTLENNETTPENKIPQSSKNVFLRQNPPQNTIVIKKLTLLTNLL